MTIFAFFNHPAMLGWLAAAAAPLIIHLLSRRRHREMPWAAMRYLLAAVRKSSRRIRIEQWLLLAVRTGIIVLAVVALAEPFLERAGLNFVSGQRTHKLLVIDASYSMQYRAADKSLFERAKEMAGRIVDESSQGDGFTLVLMASPPRVVVGTPAFERAEFHDELDHLQPLDGGADLAATLAKIEEVLATAHHDHARLTRHEIYFLTDLGRTTWLPDLHEGEQSAKADRAQAAADFLELSKRLGTQAAIVVADLGQDQAENLAIESLVIAEPYVTIGRELALEAVVRNFGRQQHSRQLVELFVDGRRAGEDHVDLPPGDTASSTFAYRFDSPGEHQIEIRLAGDLLDVDNHRWRSLPVAGRLRVLCVNGKPAGGVFQGATDYLVVALAPHGPTDDRAPVLPEVVSESALVEIDLEPYDCIFLCNVGQFTANEARVLSAYVEHGGGLVFFLGDLVQAESYNRHLVAGADGGVDVLPARLGDKVVGQTPCYPDPMEYRHPLIAPFRGRERAGLLNTPIYGFFKLLVPDRSAAQIALKLSTGDPAIVEAPIGRGRSIVVATSADASWTAMPTWPSYVPVVQELLSLAVSGQADDRNLTVGQPLVATLRTLATDTLVSVEAPGGENHTVRLEPEGDYSRWTYADTGRSGFYKVALDAPLSRNETYAVNVDASEGDLTKLDLAELRRDVWPGVSFDLFDGHDPSHQATVPIVRRDALDRWLLYGVLGLLLVETGLASWFGRRSS
jgi:hypothetical protein